MSAISQQIGHAILRRVNMYWVGANLGATSGNNYRVHYSFRDTPHLQSTQIHFRLGQAFHPRCIYPETRCFLFTVLLRRIITVSMIASAAVTWRTADLPWPTDVNAGT